MNYDDFKAARDFISHKALQLMKHEDKEYAKTGFPPQNYTVYPIQNRVFYSVGTNVFLAIVRDVLPEAIKKFPDKFGTGNAMDVLTAIYDTQPMFDFDRFVKFLQTEQFSVLVENEKGEIKDKILRIDLFRKLDEGGKVFTGGIFHAFKHFSMNGTNLSTGQDINDVPSPEKVIDLAVKAFFLEEHEQSIRSHLNFESRIEINDKYCLKFVFYYEANTGVYFIKTIHIEPK